MTSRPNPKPGDEQRRQYRTSTPMGDEFTGDVLVPGDVPIRLHLLDVSYGGARFQFPRERWPDLVRGAELRICFRFELGRPVVLTSQVRTLSEAGGDWSVGVQFLDAEKLDGLLIPSQWRYFNRRQAFRVKPRSGQRIDVALGWRETKRLAGLADISVSGLCIKMSWPDPELPTLGEPLALGLKLPGGTRPISVIASLVNARVVDGEARWGVRFDTERTVDWAEKEREIVRYLMLRQRQDLQLKRAEQERRESA